MINNICELINAYLLDLLNQLQPWDKIYISFGDGDDNGGDRR